MLGIIFFIIFSISGIYALYNDVINNTESTISTSYVDIKIEEYENGDPYTKENEVVMPGETVLLNSKINNIGIESYIRVKITYSINDIEYNELDYINGEYQNWNKNGDYYYYGSSVQKNESIDLFDSIKVPNEIINESSGDKVVINIIAEAIQAKNFNGNWNEVEIKESVNRSYSMDAEGKSEIIYENHADRYLDVGDGFFDNLGELLPGDSVNDKITISNNSKNRIRYFMSIDISKLNQEEINLLKNIKIVAKNNKGKTIIENNLTEISNILLGTYNSGEQEEITFSISLPDNLDNEYSKIATKLTWIFSVEEEQNGNNPSTGDLGFDWSITLFLLSAVGLLIIMILEKQENVNIEKNKVGKRKKI